MASKVLVMGLTWGVALLASFAFRAWGDQHPEPFLIRPFIVLTLLLGPSILLGILLLPQVFFKMSWLNAADHKNISDESTN